MNYKIHPDLKSLSANLKRLDLGNYFYSRDFKIELEEYGFDELWEVSEIERKKYLKVINLTSINFYEYTENFIIGLDIIYREYINKNFDFVKASEHFCDFFLTCFLYYLNKVKIEYDYSKLLAVIYQIELFDDDTLRKIEAEIKSKKYNKTDEIKIEIEKKSSASVSKKYQIFISSTFTDLKEERQAAVEAILKKGHIPAGMELFAAGDKSQWEVIKKWIDDSDIYLLILGGRYGSIDKESGLSYTEMEYKYAKNKKKPLFALILSDKILDKKDINIIKDFDLKDPKYISFKENVKTNMCSFPENIDQIKNEISHSLDTLINDNKDKMNGWIKGTI